MKKITFCLFILAIAGCGAKRTQNNLASGNYDQAISIAVDHLKNNKDKKGKQEFIYMLEEAFAKANERDLREVEMYVKEANPRNLEKIYHNYQSLHDRQEKIRPLLPLRLLNEKRNAIFPFDNYSDEIISSKNALSKYLYDNSVKLLKSATKAEARKVYDDLLYLNQINSGYKDVKQLLEEAQFKGTDFVSVYTKNETNIMIPLRLQEDLLDFSTYGLNDKWVEYHSNKQQGINYDYGLVINFRNISISPEQIKETEFVKEKDIKFGTKKLRDRLGNVVLDSLGNEVVVDDIRRVRATINEFKQFKACQVTAKIDYIDFNSKQLLQSFPITSEFIFENVYANVRGDRRAADQSYFPILDNRPMRFPSSEQMVYDTGEDLKNKLKSIITRNEFRRN